jgi:hypothetical protein
MAKTILSTDAPMPLTIEREGGKVRLQIHLSILTMGETSAKWLHNALKGAIYGGVSSAQILEHEGQTAMTVISDGGYIFIKTDKSRFNMKSEVAVRIIEWMDKN